MRYPKRVRLPRKRKIRDLTDWGMIAEVYLCNLVIVGKDKEARRIMKKYRLPGYYYKKAKENIKRKSIKFTEKQIKEAKKRCAIEERKLGID
ncbi:MAG: hypothetical protein AABY22_35855 [Nanoarchaeota archaeon]